MINFRESLGVTCLIVQTAFQDCSHSFLNVLFTALGDQEPSSFPSLPAAGLLGEQPPITFSWLSGPEACRQSPRPMVVLALVCTDERDEFPRGGTA